MDNPVGSRHVVRRSSSPDIPPPPPEERPAASGAANSAVQAGVSPHVAIAVRDGAPAGIELAALAPDPARQPIQDDGPPARIWGPSARAALGGFFRDGLNQALGVAAGLAVNAALQQAMQTPAGRVLAPLGAVAWVAASTIFTRSAAEALVDGIINRGNGSRDCARDTLVNALTLAPPVLLGAALAGTYGFANHQHARDPEGIAREPEMVVAVVLAGMAQRVTTNLVRDLSAQFSRGLWPSVSLASVHGGPLSPATILSADWQRVPEFVAAYGLMGMLLFTAAQAYVQPAISEALCEETLGTFTRVLAGNAGMGAASIMLEAFSGLFQALAAAHTAHTRDMGVSYQPGSAAAACANFANLAATFERVRVHTGMRMELNAAADLIRTTLRGMQLAADNAMKHHCEGAPLPHEVRHYQIAVGMLAGFINTFTELRGTLIADSDLLRSRRTVFDPHGESWRIDPLGGVERVAAPARSIVEFAGPVENPQHRRMSARLRRASRSFLDLTEDPDQLANEGRASEAREALVAVVRSLEAEDQRVPELLREASNSAAYPAVKRTRLLLDSRGEVLQAMEQQGDDADASMHDGSSRHGPADHEPALEAIERREPDVEPPEPPERRS